MSKKKTPALEVGEWVDIDSITGWDKNPRNNDHVVPQIAESIKRFGWGNPILARRADRVVIAGHTRLKAARSLGMDKVPVRWMDLDPAQAAALALADNKLGELAEWDDAGLREVLAELEADGLDLDGLGWNDEELSALLEEAGDEMSPEKEPMIEPSPGEPVSRRGEVYQLGPHTLVCGDCTDPDSWPERADLCFTSPPYNVNKSSAKLSNREATKGRESFYVSDEAGADWLPMLVGFTDNALQSCSALVCNIQMLSGNKRDLLLYLAHYKDRMHDLCIWDKGHTQPAMMPGVLNSAFELIAVIGDIEANRRIPFSSFHGTQDNIIRIPRQSANDFAGLHAATMPMDLPLYWLREISSEARSVVDPFGGTGTTLIACAQLGRTAHLIEIEPLYCDIIRRRWTQYARDNGVDPGPGALEPVEAD